MLDAEENKIRSIRNAPYIHLNSHPTSHITNTVQMKADDDGLSTSYQPQNQGDILAATLHGSSCSPPHAMTTMVSALVPKAALIIECCDQLCRETQRNFVAEKLGFACY